VLLVRPFAALVSPGSSLSFGSKRIDFGRLGLCGNLTTYGNSPDRAHDLQSGFFIRKTFLRGTLALQP